MDWRWLVVSLGVAAIAAVRLRRRPPSEDAKTGTPAGGTGAGRPSPVTRADVTPDDPGDDTPDDPGDGSRGGSPDDGMDDALDRALDRAGERPATDASRRDHPPADDGAATVDADGGVGGPDHPVGPETVGAALERVWAEHVGTADTLLESRLRLLVHRGVPARAIRPAPGTRTVRVVFADGTVVLCRGSGQGDFGRLSLAMLHHSVRLGSFRRSGDGTLLEFRWHPDQRLSAVAVGLDQPD